MINWSAVGSPLRGEEEWHWELPSLLGHPAAKFSGWSQRCRRSGIRGVYHRALFLRCHYRAEPVVATCGSYCRQAGIAGLSSGQELVLGMQWAQLIHASAEQMSLWRELQQNSCWSCKSYPALKLLPTGGPSLRTPCSFSGGSFEPVAVVPVL